MLLDEMAAIFGINPSSIKTTTLRLPSTKKGPLSSSWLIRDDSSVEEASGLSPCYTDDLAFTPSPSNLRIICPSSHLWLGFGAEDMEFDLHVPKVEAEGQNSKIMIRSLQRRFNFARGLS